MQVLIAMESLEARRANKEAVEYFKTYVDYFGDFLVESSESHHSDIYIEDFTQRTLVLHESMLALRGGDVGLSVGMESTMKVRACILWTFVTIQLTPTRSIWIMYESDAYKSTRSEKSFRCQETWNPILLILWKYSSHFQMFSFLISRRAWKAFLQVSRFTVFYWHFYIWRHLSVLSHPCNSSCTTTANLGKVPPDIYYCNIFLSCDCYHTANLSSANIPSIKYSNQFFVADIIGIQHSICN